MGDEQDLYAMVQSVCKKEGVLLYYFAGFGKTKTLKNSTSIKRGSSVIAKRNDEKVELKNVEFTIGDLEGIL